MAAKPEPGPRSRLLLHANIIGAPTLKAPKVVAHRGQPFHYRIVLKNVSGEPFSFRGKCPTYQETLLLAGSTSPNPQVEDTFVLNCKPMGTLKPRERAVFEMVIRIPADAALGRAGLDWVLAPDSYEPPWVPGEVLVVG